MTGAATPSPSLPPEGGEGREAAARRPDSGTTWRDLARALAALRREAEAEAITTDDFIQNLLELVAIP